VLEAQSVAALRLGTDHAASTWLVPAQSTSPASLFDRAARGVLEYCLNTEFKSDEDWRESSMSRYQGRALIEGSATPAVFDGKFDRHARMSSKR